MKKVLIIAYKFPRIGGGGIIRIAKFCKYLQEFGWYPIVLTIDNLGFQEIDYDLFNKIKDKCRIYKKKFIPSNQSSYFKFLKKLYDVNYFGDFLSFFKN